MTFSRAQVKKRESPIIRQAFPFEVVHVDEPANNMAAFHWHDFLEISFVERGAGRYEVEDKTFEVRAGDMVIINNIERHRVTYDPSRPLYETVFHFTADFIGGRAGYRDLFDYQGLHFVNKPALDAQAAREARSIVHRIAREFVDRKRHYELVIHAKLLELIALLLRSVKESARPVPDLSARKANIKRLEKITNYLKENVSSDLRLAGLAARFGYNPTYFSEYFKTNIGVGLREYVNALRIQKSLPLLNEGRLTADRIAFECGFSSATSFYAAFRKVMGTTPQKHLKIRTN